MLEVVCVMIFIIVLFFFGDDQKVYLWEMCLSFVKTKLKFLFLTCFQYLW